MKSIKELKKLNPNDHSDSIKYNLHKKLCGADPARSIHTLHASELTREKREFCPREYALLELTKKKIPDGFLSTSLQVTYAMGRIVQDIVVDTLADMDKAVGSWGCMVCGTVTRFAKRPNQCDKCGCMKFEPIEERFTSAISGASCGIDMLWNNKQQKHTILEIKTMDKDEFKTLKAPLAEHRVRTNFYMRIVAESDAPEAQRIRTDEARILYISKGGFGCKDEEVGMWDFYDSQFSPFKEFIVKRDDTLTEGYTKKGMELMEWRANKKGPLPNKICGNALFDRAKQCHTCKECFSVGFNKK